MLGSGQKGEIKQHIGDSSGRGIFIGTVGRTPSPSKEKSMFDSVFRSTIQFLYACIPNDLMYCIDAGIYYLRCRFDDAEEACRNAIEILEETFGPASPITTTPLELLANIMRDTLRAGTVPAP